jgi:hypothetical protein
MRKEKITNMYVPRIGAPFREEDAQDIGEFIYVRNNGKTTEELLAAIENDKQSTIAKYIEWNDKKASRQYRLHQVRNIANHVEIEIIVTRLDEPSSVPITITTRAGHSINLDDARRYYDYHTVLATPEYREQILARAKTELKNWMERYEVYQELSHIISVIRSEISNPVVYLEKEKVENPIVS